MNKASTRHCFFSNLFIISSFLSEYLDLSFGQFAFRRRFRHIRPRPAMERALAGADACGRNALGYSFDLPDGGYRRFWQETELPCHADVISGRPMFDDQAVFHPEHVEL